VNAAIIRWISSSYTAMSQQEEIINVENYYKNILICNGNNICFLLESIELEFKRG
jgi:hypothetical protein